MSWAFADLPRHHFQAVLADPPWKYRTWSEAGNGRAAPYPTMAIEEIAALPVRDLAANDCMLVMWTTPPFLRLSMDVLEAWGFTYTTCGSWAKLTADGGGLATGTGYYWRGSSEIWLMGKRGSVPRYRGPAIPNCILAPRMAHSRKPDRLHEDIEAMVPCGPWCELFARRRRRGWHVWGNQLPVEAAA